MPKTLFTHSNLKNISCVKEDCAYTNTRIHIYKDFIKYNCSNNIIITTIYMIPLTS